MELNLNRRYSEKKGLSKRKCSQENIPPETEDCLIEEERQFKLKRFVKDVEKYVEQKEKPHRKVQKNIKLNNMIQSKVWTRGDLGDEVKKKLELDMRQIIGLGNKADCNCNCMRHCNRLTKKPTQKPVVHTIQEQSSSNKPTQKPVVHTVQEPLDSLLPQTTPSALSCNRIPRAHITDHTSQRTDEHTSSAKSTLSSDELDNKLYPEFIRIVTSRCLQFKSAHFKNESYAHSLKGKLLAIYKNKSHCCSEERLMDKSRSSVATSPMAASLEPIEDSDQRFTLNFVRDRRKRTTNILEEIAPRPSVDESHYREDESSSSDLNRTCQPPPFEPYSNHRLFMGREQPCYEPLSVKLPLPPVYNYTQITLDGPWGDPARLFNQTNACLPPCDEESPTFKYFPRRIF